MLCLCDAFVCCLAYIFQYEFHSVCCRKFDASDLKSLLASGLAVLSEGVPSVGGFLAGFALGLK